MEQKAETMELYERKGQASAAVSALVTLIVGIGIAVLILIFVGALSGQTYQLVEADLTAITNDTIENHVKEAIISGFEGLEQTGKYIPIIVLAVVISLVIGLVLSFSIFTQGGGMGGRGSAL